jgi:hypothetical protein
MYSIVFILSPLQVNSLVTSLNISCLEILVYAMESYKKKNKKKMRNNIKNKLTTHIPYKNLINLIPYQLITYPCQLEVMVLSGSPKSYELKKPCLGIQKPINNYHIFLFPVKTSPSNFRVFFF